LKFLEPVSRPQKLLNISAAFFWVTIATGQIAETKLKNKASIGGKHKEKNVSLGNTTPDTTK
jgi:hypothetical protein